MIGDRSRPPPGPLSAAGLGVIAATVAIDQTSKLIADAAIGIGARIDLVPGLLSLYRVNNTGIAFSFLSDSGVVLIALMLIVTVVILAMWRSARDGGPLAAAGFALIVGGAIGNLIDRVRLGHVIDFLFLHIGDRPMFVFNLADAALTLGPALLVLHYLLPAPDTA